MGATWFFVINLTFAFVSFLVNIYKKARKFIVVVFQFKKILRSHDFKSVVTAKNAYGQAKPQTMIVLTSNKNIILQNSIFWSINANFREYMKTIGIHYSIPWDFQNPPWALEDSVKTWTLTGKPWDLAALQTCELIGQRQKLENMFTIIATMRFHGMNAYFSTM